MAARIPPFAAEAEGSVLSACIVRGATAVDEVGDLLSPERFYSEAHRRIFEACASLAASSQPVDIRTVAEWLREHRRLEQVGGLGYLTEILNSAPSVSTRALRMYATTVRNCSTLRDVLTICQQSEAEIYDGVPEVELFLQGLEAKLHDSTSCGRVANIRVMRDVIRSTAEALQRRQSSGIVSGIPTGLSALDFVTGGLHPTDLTIVAARPGMGKTSLALQFALEVSRKGHGAIMFSLEMPEEQIGNRLLAMEGRVDLKGMRSAKYSTTDWSRIIDASASLSTLPMYVVDQADTPLSTMRTMVRRAQSTLAAEGRTLGIVVVDYLQLMTGRPGKHTRDEVVSEITRGLKAMAKESRVAVVALSQLNRDVEKRTDKRPMLSDLRESGAIEQDADNVLFIYRDDYYNRESQTPGIAELIVAKQRNGPTEMVRVQFRDESTRFDNIEADEYE